MGSSIANTSSSSSNRVEQRRKQSPILLGAEKERKDQIQLGIERATSSLVLPLCHWHLLAKVGTSCALAQA
jgi:hypothetical protein